MNQSMLKPIKYKNLNFTREEESVHVMNKISDEHRLTHMSHIQP